MENRYIILGIGIVVAVGQMMAPIPILVGLPLLVIGLWFIAWGILGKPFQNKIASVARPLYRAMLSIDRILERTSGHAEALEDKRADLEVRFNGKVEPYIIGSGAHFYCRFAVYNKGPAPAENVRVWLNAIDPRPILPDGYYPPHFPSPVTMITRIDAIDLRINRQEEMWFEPLSGFRREPGHNIIHRLAAINAQIDVHEGDHWEMTFAVQAANANEVTFALSVVFTIDGFSATRMR